jgi:CRP-like cAMP-binding protein
MWDVLIKNLSRYVTLTNDEASVIKTLFSHKKFRKHQYILQEGSVSKHETFIAKGVARIYQVDEKGNEHIVQFGLEDWWVGDMYSFLTGTPSIYNIDCLEEAEVFQITKADMETLYVKVPKMERHFRIMVQHAFIASTRRVSSSLAKNALDRYLEFIHKYPQIEQRVPNHQIASYLGITPQSLSRLRSQATSQSKRKKEH